MKRRVIGTLKIAVGLGLVAALVASGNIDPSRLAKVKDNWPYFLAAQGLFLVVFFATLVRWRLVLRALDVPAHMSDVIRLGWIGLLFSQVIPGSTGGDVVKGVYIARESPNRRAEAVLSVVLDRVIGLTALMLLGGVALCFNIDLVLADPILRKMVWVLGAAVLAVIVGGALVAWEGFWRQGWLRAVHRRLPGREVVSRLARALWTVRGKRKLLVVSLVMSVAIHSVNILCHLCLATALLGETPSPSAYFFLIPVGQLAFALPVSPGGLGVGEWAYKTLFEMLGQRSGAEVAVLVRTTLIIWALPGFIFYLRGKKELKEAILAAEEITENLVDSPEVEMEPEKVISPE